MAVSKLPLSYCGNVHPGRTFEEMLEGLSRYTQPVAKRLGRQMAIGLWLPNSAIAQVAASPELGHRLAGWLKDANLTCYTMNAFPFGDFHADKVKREVYLPDWSSTERISYTLAVANLLAALLPESGEGSVSTLPGGFKALRAGRDWSDHFPNLIETATALAELKKRTGRTVRLAIEPEPLCEIETTAEAVAFFRNLADEADRAGKLREVAEHIGLCLDVCHQAVEFEDIAESVRWLTRERIRIVKVHITCALELREPHRVETRRELARFVEPRYLHQTFGRRANGGALAIEDLSTSFLESPPAEWLDCDTWRVHFHVPVHLERIGGLHTTRPALVEALQAIAELDYAPHLEVETYTWGVLPERKSDDLISGLVAELSATNKLLDAT